MISRREFIDLFDSIKFDKPVNTNITSNEFKPYKSIHTNAITSILKKTRGRPPLKRTNDYLESNKCFNRFLIKNGHNPIPLNTCIGLEHIHTPKIKTCVKYNCYHCKGGGICDHNVRREYCVACNGKSVCIHNRDKNICRICKYPCSHSEKLKNCKICTKNNLCEHEKVKEYCFYCYPDLLCFDHYKMKKKCVKCSPKNKDDELCIGITKSERFVLNNEIVQTKPIIYPQNPYSLFFQPKSSVSALTIFKACPNSLS